MTRMITFTLNGEPVAAEIKPHHNLVELLQRDFNLMGARESCGQCSPCRVGTTKMARAISDGSLDHATLNDLSVAMSEASICALGRNAGKFLARVIRTLPERQL